jgi:hypothetical protein
MKRLCVTPLLVVFLMACSGSDKEPVDTTSTADVIDDTAGGEVQVGDDVLDEDGVANSDIPEGDVAGDQTVEPVSPYSDGMLEQLCDTYCDPENGCDDVDYGADCVADCVVLATADQAIPKKIACAREDDQGGSFCDRYDECDGDYEYNADCVTLCADVEACDALGTELFGNNLEDCALVCSGSIGMNPGAGDILDCIGGALENCSGTEFFSCIESNDSETCEVELCGADVDPFCSLVPDTFETTEECAGSCADWSAGQGLAAQMCLEMGTNLPVDCADLYSNCLAVPEAPQEGALEYCKLSHEKCGPLGENDIYDTLGGLGHDFCAWQMTGIVQTKPGGFRPLTEAVTCMEGLETCPSGDLSSIYCLIDITAEHIATCAAVADLCTDPAVAGDVTLDCEAALGFAAGFIPEAVEMIEGCITGAADCDGLSTCFFGDEGEDGQ